MSKRTHFTIQRILLNLAALLIIFSFTLAAGCAPKLDAATQAKVHAIQQQTPVKLAQIKADATTHAAEGQTAPLSHPWYALNDLVVEVRPILLILTVLTGLGWALVFALGKAGYSIPFVGSKATTVLRWLFSVNLAALLALLFLPKFIVIAGFIFGGALAALIIYELIKEKGNVKQAVADVETKLGFVVAAPVHSHATGLAASSSLASAAATSSSSAAATPDPASPPA